jgi:Patched family
VRDMLETMGPSVLVGGLSTFLGVVPLAFSSNEVNKIIFISFFAMVTLGIGHGLIFLPVVLSLVGPTNTSPTIQKRVQAPKDLEKKPAEDESKLPFWAPILQLEGPIKPTKPRQVDDDLRTDLGRSNQAIPG